MTEQKQIRGEYFEAADAVRSEVNRSLAEIYAYDFIVGDVIEREGYCEFQVSVSQYYPVYVIVDPCEGRDRGAPEDDSLELVIDDMLPYERVFSVALAVATGQNSYAIYGEPGIVVEPGAVARVRIGYHGHGFEVSVAFTR
jgi:hypothetical protein